MEKKFTFVVCLICFAWFEGSGQNAFHDKLSSLYRNSVPFIHVPQLKSLIHEHKNVILIDTRSIDEFSISHIQNAHFLDYNRFTDLDVDTLDRQMPVVVYCTVGYRSERIGEKLLRLGFKDVRNLYGGIFEWVNQGNNVINSLGKSTEQVHTYNKNWSQWLSRGVIVY